MSINVKDLLSKDNVTNLYKKVLVQSDEFKSKSEKEEMLNKLMSNMKKTYKTLDKSKINPNNFDSIRTQYNNICITETLSKKTIPKPKKSVNKLLERPTSQSKHFIN